MFRRISILTLLLMYLSTTVGFAVSIHFCGAKISNVRVNQTGKKPCCKSEDESKPDKCCKDKHVEVKVSDQQQNSASAKIPAVSSLDLFIIPFNQFVFSTTASSSAFQPDYRGPPEVGNTIPLTIKYCVFRI